MAISNRDRISKALDLLGPALGRYVDERMTLRTPEGGFWKEKWPKENLESDVSVLCAVIFQNWKPVFEEKLGNPGRSVVNDIKVWRNHFSHNNSFNADDAYRALDSMERLLALMGDPVADEIGRSKTEVMQAKFAADAKKVAPKTDGQFAELAGGLKPWREVVLPHNDVALGKYNVAEFAANLSQVAGGKGLPEYSDPVEFFRRTYLTVGLRALLTNAAMRMNGIGGDPVVDLQTNFGGGKTHSMIALFHLLSGRAVADFPQEVQDLLREAGVTSLPPVKRAVVVGTELSPGQPSIKPDGTEVRTLWGEIAWQIGGAQGFDMVAEADRTGTSPGNAMAKVFDTFGPCLVLVDEWVAYARQLFDRENLPAGSFETQFTFAQTLADAAITTPGALLVVSLPVSDDGPGPSGVAIGSELELGGPGGRIAATRLGNVIARTETPWRPAMPEESFEIVRRRLFQPIAADAVKHRDATANAFIQFYRKQAAEFPSEVQDTGYLSRMVNAYPIHPELFARLYEDWSSLEGFQRTRGVLRFMAAVISALWAAGDQSPLIMPGSVPLDVPTAVGELTRNLDHQWQPILDTDIDGEGSIPRRVDAEFGNLGRFRAAQRAARAVFLASAPRNGSGNRGVELQRVKLGCAYPGETVSTFGDALGRLADRSSFLYVEGARYWYGTQASVARRARDLVDQYLSGRIHDVRHHIEQRLRDACRERGDLVAVHVCPASSADVPDDPEARLVVLGPSTSHAKGNAGSEALAAAKEVLERRGNAARMYRNMLTFLAPDVRRLEELERGVAEFLAWRDIHDQRETLNLDAAQMRQADTRRSDAEKAVEARIGETYHWLLVPYQSDPTGAIEWDTLKCDGQGAIAARAGRKLVNSGALAVVYSPELLRSLLGSGGHLSVRWQDGHTTVAILWEDFARYPYLPRLKSIDVLIATVGQGPNSITWESTGVAVADAFDDKAGRYLNLVGGGLASGVKGTTLVVEPARARVQLDTEQGGGGAPSKPTEGRTGEDDQTGSGTGSGGSTETTGAGPAAVTRFYGVARLDPERAQRDFGKLATEVIAHLSAQLETEVEISLEIKAHRPKGFTEQVIRTVSENATTLKFDQSGFEKD